MTNSDELTYYCTECGEELTKDMDVCPGCDCSIEGFIDLGFEDDIQKEDN